MAEYEEQRGSSFDDRQEQLAATIGAHFGFAADHKALASIETDETVRAPLFPSPFPSPFLLNDLFTSGVKAATADTDLSPPCPLCLYANQPLSRPLAVGVVLDWHRYVTGSVLSRRRIMSWISSQV